MQGIGLPRSYGPPRSDPLNRASRAAAPVRSGPMASAQVDARASAAASTRSQLCVPGWVAPVLR